MSYKTIWIVLIVCMIIVIAVYNNLTNHKTDIEGFDCAVENVFAKTKSPNTGIVIIQYFQLFATFAIIGKGIQNLCTTAYKDYDECNKKPPEPPEIINISFMNNTWFNDDKTSLMHYISVLTKMYDKVDTFTPNIISDSTSNICGCYKQIMQNFNNYYIKENRYNSSDIKTYHSIVRFFFDVVNTTDQIVYTGLGNYKGSYDVNYYNKFDSNTIEEVIKKETVELMNPKYTYYLNVFSVFLLSNSSILTDDQRKPLRNSTSVIFDYFKTNSVVDKESVKSIIIQIAHVLRYKYGKIVNAPYNMDTNPFPGKTMKKSDINISGIIKKVRYRTFENSDLNTFCSGTELKSDTNKVLNNVSDKKYFVSYLKAVIKTIKVQSPVSTNGVVDGIETIINVNDIDDKGNVLLQTGYILSSNPENMYNLMDFFGTFDKRTNVYTLNQTGLSILQKMSIDEISCMIDYLERMAILIFTPIKYGGPVNYDRWMFFK